MDIKYDACNQLGQLSYAIKGREIFEFKKGAAAATIRPLPHHSSFCTLSLSDFNSYSIGTVRPDIVLVSLIEFHSI